MILDGIAEIIIGGEPHTLKSGEFIIMPEGIPHAVKAKERFKMLVMMIKEKETVIFRHHNVFLA